MKIYLFVLLAALFYRMDAMAIEEPKYTETVNYKDFEVRSYAPMLVAQTEVKEHFDDAGNKAFRVLADFIFGNNTSKTKIDMTAPVTQKTASEKIAMTAPVTQSKSSTGFVIQFTMPAAYTRETLPQPNDPRVKIVEIPARKMAVYSYTGSWSESRFNDKLADFKAALAREKIVTVGEPTFARFNSPWQLPFLRRNEIWLEVAKLKTELTPGHLGWPQETSMGSLQVATLAGGCFWGLEKLLGEIPGVVDTRVGYSGGGNLKVGYKDVSTGRTGHAETVQVLFDSTRVSYEKIIKTFFSLHDPTTLNRQGNDIGTQYRSAIFFHDPEQKKIAEKVIAQVDASKKWGAPVVTQVEAFRGFVLAEPEHQKYLQKNPDGYTCHYDRKFGF